MSETEIVAFKELQRVACELVKAESLEEDTRDRPQEIMAERARRAALGCMRLLGHNELGNLRE